MVTELLLMLCTHILAPFCILCLLCNNFYFEFALGVPFSLLPHSCLTAPRVFWSSIPSSHLQFRAGQLSYRSRHAGTLSFADCVTTFFLSRSVPSSEKCSSWFRAARRNRFARVNFDKKIEPVSSQIISEIIII